MISREYFPLGIPDNSKTPLASDKQRFSEPIKVILAFSTGSLLLPSFTTPLTVDWAKLTLLIPIRNKKTIEKRTIICNLCAKVVLLSHLRINSILSKH